VLVIAVWEHKQMQQVQHDVNTLVKRVESIGQSVSAFEETGRELVPIFRRPGWTTVAEFALVEAQLEAIHQQLELAARQYRQLVSASKQVGES
jgi:DNA anti-recombination protein RmuC